MNVNLKQNKKNAIDFYRMAYEGNPKKAVEFVCPMSREAKAAKTMIVLRKFFMFPHIYFIHDSICELNV